MRFNLVMSKNIWTILIALTFIVHKGYSQMAGPPCNDYPIVNTISEGLVPGDAFNGPCGPDVPHFIVDLSSNPDTTWISDDTIRFGDRTDRCNTCCSSDPSDSPPPRCISFEVTLHPSSAGLNFFVASGAPPTGSLGWQLMDMSGTGTCGPENDIGVDICLDGPGPHYILFVNQETTKTHMVFVHLQRLAQDLQM